MRLEGLQNAQVGTQNGDGLSATRQQTGSWRGETLSVQKSTATLLADAAEELTFAQAEREEEKDISERRVDAPGAANIPQIQEIMEYLEQMGDENDQAKLEELAAKLRSSGGAGAGQAVANAFDDVSKQFLALSYLVRHFEGSDGDEGALGEIRATLEELHEDRGPEIRAGLNSAARAHEFADGDPDRAQSLRECYRETVLGHENLGETFNSVLQRFGSSDVRRSIEFLIRAAGDDLGSRGPSTSPAELKSILEDLYQLEVLATVLEGCNEMAVVMERDFSVPTIDPDVLMKRVIGLTGERWITSDRIASLGRDMGVHEIEASIGFLSRLRGILREMPLKVFNDQETRDRLLNAAQEALGSGD